MKNYWLVKTEEDVYPISQLKKDKTTLWDCVRNYQARNYLKQMKKGDFVFIYHSNSKETGIVGISQVLKEFEPDPTQFDKKSDYFDEKATKETPRWFAPTLKFLKEYNKVIGLSELKTYKEMKDSPLIKAGNRLSVIPIAQKEAKLILSLCN